MFGETRDEVENHNDELKIHLFWSGSLEMMTTIPIAYQ